RATIDPTHIALNTHYHNQYMMLKTPILLLDLFIPTSPIAPIHHYLSLPTF
ncbi:hypothetical protein C7212DRAFT_315972, partial [Tuber magnatum]